MHSVFSLCREHYSTTRRAMPTRCWDWPWQWSATVVLTARLREAAERARGIELSRAEAERLDRRLAFFAEANVVLAASLDYHVTLRNLSRLMVPTLADWCAIHVTSEQGALQFIAGAHRDPE